MKRLDLGGTACYEDPDAISISLDGSNSDDEVTPVIVGDYNDMPFEDNTFDEALGSCYLEERPNWSELCRVMKPGAKVIVKSCERMYADENVVYTEAEAAGFILVEAAVWVDDYGYDSPAIFRKE